MVSVMMIDLLERMEDMENRMGGNKNTVGWSRADSMAESRELGSYR